MITPIDFIPKKDKDKTDQKKWTPSRKADFDFYTKVLNGLPRSHKLLDVGCGLGQFRALFSEFNYFGFDIYPYQWVKIVADFTKPFPVEKESFEIVVLSNVLEHTPDPQLMISESYKALRKGGLVVGSVPFFAEVHEEPYDFLRYTDIMLKKLFTETGFKEITVLPLERPLDIYVWNQDKFIKQLRKAKMNKVCRLAAMIFIKLTKLSTSLFSYVLKIPQADRTLTRRYGFYATK